MLRSSSSRFSAASRAFRHRPCLLRLANQQPVRYVQQRSEAPTAAASVTAAAAQQENPRPAAFQSLLGITNEKDIKNTFYQRQLPKSLVRFSSDQGKKLFRSAMEAGHAEGFFSLTGNFTTQSEPAYCGPSSLAMVLNALEVDPKRRWKGNWRWFSDELLECCSSKEEMKKNGITFDKFACLAKCHCDVVVKRGNEITLQEFIKDVESVTSRSDQFMVISFSRKTLGQTGDGHFSPIGAYNTESKMVLVLDTARYKYPSYWCPIDVLLESMKPIDKETGRPRGYFLLSYDAEHPPVSLCKVQAMQKPSNENEQSADEAANTTTLNWSTLAKSFCKRIPENMWLEKPRTLEHVVQLVLRNVPPEYTVILANQSFASTRATTPERASEYIDQLLQDTAQSALYPIVFDALYPNKSSKWLDHHAAFATLFVLGSPRMLYTSLPRELQDTLDKYRKEEYMSDIVQREVKRISEEVSELTKSFCTCGPGWNETAPKDCA